jgi:Uma2 family endonuclease
MPSVDTKRYTYEDYAQLPEGSTHQLINGELVMTPAPGIIHQKVSGRLEFALREFVSREELGEVLDAPTDVLFSDTDTFQPDILFVPKRRLRIITEEKVEGAPDLIVEVLSPTTGYYDLTYKKSVYESSGVKEYWLVDPHQGTVEVLTNTPAGFQIHEKGKRTGIVHSKLLEGFQVDLEKLFGGL